MGAYLSKRPMLLCGIFACIISVAGYYSRSALLMFGIVLGILTGVLILKKTKFKFILVTLILQAIVISEMFSLNNAQSLDLLKGKEADVKFTVCEVTYKSDFFGCADIEITENGTLKKGTKLSAYYSGYLKTGDTATGKITLSSVNGAKYKKDYYSREIYLTGYLSQVKVVGKEPVLTKVEAVRDYISDTLFLNLKYDEAATLAALIFGERDYFSAEFYENVKASGVAHVMVVSGMHLTILVMFFVSVTQKLLYNRFVKALIMVMVTLLLTALCGFTMSMLRAGVTYFLSAIALVLNKQRDPENILGGAVSLILIFSPFAFLSVAFRLSVLSTFGILSVALPTVKYIKEKKLIRSKLLFALASSVIITLSALLLTLPVAIETFGYVSTVGVITNLLISQAVTVSLWLSVTALIINLVLPFIAKMIFLLVNLIIMYINYVINLFGSLKYSIVATPQYFSLITAVFIIITFWILLACKKRGYVVKLKEIDDKILKEGGKTRNGGSF